METVDRPEAGPAIERGKQTRRERGGKRKARNRGNWPEIRSETDGSWHSRGTFVLPRGDILSTEFNPAFIEERARNSAGVCQIVDPAQPTSTSPSCIHVNVPGETCKLLWRLRFFRDPVPLGSGWPRTRSRPLLSTKIVARSFNGGNCYC